MAELGRTMSAGALLVHSDTSTTASTDLKALLISRLARYREHLALPSQDYTSATLEHVQRETAVEALAVVSRVQQILDQDALATDAEAEAEAEAARTTRRTTTTARPSTSQNARDDGPGEPPKIGTRDISQLRTLLSIVVKWGTEPLLARLQPHWPSKPTARAPPGPRIVDLADTTGDHDRLASLALRLFALLFPRGVHGSVPQTLLSTAILNRHLADLLRPALALGWLPKSLSSASSPAVDALRPFVMRVLSMLPPSQTIAALGAVLSGPAPPAAHVQKACSSMMSRQLLRPDGVRGLCAALFGEGADADEQPSLERLENFARVLSTVPANMDPEAYYSTVTRASPPPHRRAAAFSLSRMLSSAPSNLLLPLLPLPFLRPTAALDPSTPSPSSTLRTLQTLLTNTDPSPTLISTLLSPVAPALYAILAALERTTAADPAVREGVRGLLLTWGRVVAASEAVAILWACVEDQGGIWTADITGELKRVERLDRAPPLALFTPETLRRAEADGEMDADANFLGLRPDPAHFVRFLRALERAEVASEVFVRFLEAYRESKAAKDADPMRQMAAGSSSTNILSKPEHILSFVKHALETEMGTSTPAAPPEDTKPVPKKPGLTMDDLRIVDEEDEDEEALMDADGDSDDETPGMEDVPPDEEMTVTAINLLLSILEANPDLSTRTAPVLADMFPQVEHLATKHPSEAIRSLAREARMVLTVRIASSSAPASSRTSMARKATDVQETYQKALKLLQDPILPVRAHGLLLLRELVTPSPARAPTPPTPPADLQPLVPAILDIFLQSVQDDDSYIFLNAVQGLSALVDGFGKDVLKALVRVYTAGLDGVAGGALTKAEVDTRLKVGEALGQVVRRCGEALPLHADALVPPLFAVVRAAHLPTALRTSALALLGQCADATDLALVPYAADLADAMVHLLQIESVRAGPRPARVSGPGEKGRGGRDAGKPEGEDGDEDGDEDGGRKAPPPEEATMDSAPTAANAKFPPFRRAALHFLALLVRAYTRRAYADGPGLAALREFPTGRVKNTLGYVAATDADAVVRVMALEVGEAVEGLERARLGL
ncbi:hypothetical protein OF83DRAFT_1276666 [Amylostereum chailletii]|nr:hypothetical protein OF83DRAFT_1276666 [Amylostereum chailletii]